MLESLELQNLTVFAKADFKFARGLNVLVGENGAGKTHVLKAAYSAIYASAKGRKDSGSASPPRARLQTAVADTLGFARLAPYFQTTIANKLNAVFKPDELGRLARRQAGRKRCEIRCRFAPSSFDLEFSFSESSSTEVKIEKLPSEWIEKWPVYLPTRELLTIYPGFVSLYETSHIPFEETWRDTCILLGAPLIKNPRSKRSKELLGPLEEAMGGTIDLDDSGRFYLSDKAGRIEMHLVAEGLRKLAMIARLIATGALTDKGYLFWDEPEANLNPRVIGIIAKTILHLCNNGIQVFIASHSLFLLRELDIQLQSGEFKKTPARFFGLHRTERGVEVQQGDTIDAIGKIAALDEELNQSERYLEAGH